MQILQHPLHLPRCAFCADDVTRLGTTRHAAHAVFKAHTARADSDHGRHLSIAFKPALPSGRATETCHFAGIIRRELACRKKQNILFTQKRNAPQNGS
jgi:hypothetical protein